VTRILIIVQNLPVPFDRRVWLECQALVSEGYEVAVICPNGDGDPSYEVIDGVELFRYRPYALGGSKAGFIAEYGYSFLATARLTLSPDPKNPLNDVSTMNKTMEYMAFELPVVAFDLRETRVSAANTGVYVEPNDVNEYAAAIVELLDDEPRRSRLGKLGRARVEQELAWSHQQRAYLGVYRGVMAGSRTPARTGG
jgi:glycosyltransferase involved in cell wall biosynthesis